MITGQNLVHEIMKKGYKGIFTPHTEHNHDYDGKSHRTKLAEYRSEKSPFSKTK